MEIITVSIFYQLAGPSVLLPCITCSKPSFVPTSMFVPTNLLCCFVRLALQEMMVSQQSFHPRPGV